MSALAGPRETFITNLRRFSVRANCGTGAGLVRAAILSVARISCQL